MTTVRPGSPVLLPGSRDLLEVHDRLERDTELVGEPAKLFGGARTATVLQVVQLRAVHPGPTGELAL